MALGSETVETLEAAALQDADPEVEEAWVAEVERRQPEIYNGTVSLLPGPETLIKLKLTFEWTTASTTEKVALEPAVSHQQFW